MNDDRLGPYRLLRRLGEGGMGVVHLAVDPQGRQVAVKVLRSEVAGDELARRRLSREVETMRRVRSRYIAEVVDADVTGHRPYIVTRYVPGRSLDEIVKEDGPLGLPALLKVAHGVAAALAAVHSVGVIHRDLKPGNVLIIDGEPVLIDFGIAQAVDATRLTQTGMFIGTPGYLAPEIIEGQEAGPEVDIHAWAGTLLYAATGQPPFGKGTLEMVFYNITAGKADVDAAPAPLQPLLKAAFQRNPAKRPKAAELAERVARLMPQAGVSVPDEVSTVPHTDPSATPAYEGPTAPGHDRGGPRPVPPVPQGSGPQAAFPQGASAGPQGPVVPPPQGPAQSLLGGAAAGAGAPAQGSGPQASGPQVPGPQASGPPAPGPQGPAAQGGARGGAAGSGEQQPDARPSWEMSTPPVTPRKLVEGQDHPVPPPAPDQQYVSLLPGQQGDPWPTRRVSPEELRQMQRDAPPGPQWQQQAGPPAGHHVPEADVPTRRVRPALEDMPTRRVRPDAPDYGRGAPVPPPPYVPPQNIPPQNIPPQAPFPPPDMTTKREPYIPGVRPGQVLQRSAAYGVASAMLLIIMIVLIAQAPVLAAIVVLPVAVLLRAADLAQPELAMRRPAGAAAVDVIRVFAYPGKLLKSIGITIALAPYGVILGVPVALLLTLLTSTDPYNAVAWGAAIALWTVCAGPGVDEPGRQMRRTLASLVPSRTTAMVLAGILAVGAALSLVLAYGTFGDNARRSTWTPVNVWPVVDLLVQLKGSNGE